MAAAGSRLTGAVVYGTAAVLLAGGLGWWLATVPDTGIDPQVVAWRKTVVRYLPDEPDQIDARTYVLHPGDALDEDAPSVFPGPHRLLLACAGRGQVRIRLSSGDSGRVIPCVDDPLPVQIEVALGGPLFLNIRSESRGSAAFRWKLVRVAGG